MTSSTRNGRPKGRPPTVCESTRGSVRWLIARTLASIRPAICAVAGVKMYTSRTVPTAPFVGGGHPVGPMTATSTRQDAAARWISSAKSTPGSIASTSMKAWSWPNRYARRSDNRPAGWLADGS